MKTYISPRHLIRAALPASLLAITMLMMRMEDAVRCSWRKCHPASDMKLQTFYLTFHIARPRNNRERERPGAGQGREVVCSKVLIRMLESGGGVVC